MRNQEDEQRVSASSPFQSQESITPLTNLQTIGKRKLCLLLSVSLLYPLFLGSSVSALSSVYLFLGFSVFLWWWFVREWLLGLTLREKRRRKRYIEWWWGGEKRIYQQYLPHTTIQRSFSSPLFPLPFLFQLKIIILAFLKL